MIPLKKITVSILGEHFHLISDEQECDILEAARLTEVTLGELRDKARHQEMPDQHIATLALLKVSLKATLQLKEVHKAQQRLQELISLADVTLSSAHLV